MLTIIIGISIQIISPGVIITEDYGQMPKATVKMFT